MEKIDPIVKMEGYNASERGIDVVVKRDKGVVFSTPSGDSVKYPEPYAAFEWCLATAKLIEEYTTMHGADAKRFAEIRAKFLASQGASGA